MARVQRRDVVYRNIQSIYTMDFKYSSENGSCTLELWEVWYSDVCTYIYGKSIQHTLPHDQWMSMNISNERNGKLKASEISHCRVLRIRIRVTRYHRDFIIPYRYIVSLTILSSISSYRLYYLQSLVKRPPTFFLSFNCFLFSFIYIYDIYRHDYIHTWLSIWLSIGVSNGIIVFQHMTPTSSGVLPAPGVNFNTMSVHRWYVVSDMCSFHCTASRNTSSFWLISAVGRPEILLQARAE